MTSIDADIWQTIRKHIDKLPAALASAAWPTWDIAYFGSNYTPSNARPFIAITRVNSQPRRIVINKNIRDWQGMVSIVAAMPIGQDPAVYADIAGDIAAHFQGKIGCGTDTVLTLMTDGGGVAYAAGGYRDGAWWREPVTIPWRTWQ